MTTLDYLFQVDPPWIYLGTGEPDVLSAGFEYDERDLLTAENRPLAAITTFTLDDMGDREEVEDPEGRTTVLTYDERRRLLTETNNASELTEYDYDGNGNRIETTRPEGQVWLYRYDEADRLRRCPD